MVLTSNHLAHVVPIDHEENSVSDPKKEFAPFVVTQKASTNTYIRFRYTTTDAPINAQIKFMVFYTELNGGTLTAV